MKDRPNVGQRFPRLTETDISNKTNLPFELKQGSIYYDIDNKCLKFFDENSNVFNPITTTTSGRTYTINIFAAESDIKNNTFNSIDALFNEVSDDNLLGSTIIIIGDIIVSNLTYSEKLLTKNINFVLTEYSKLIIEVNTDSALGTLNIVGLTVKGNGIFAIKPANTSDIRDISINNVIASNFTIYLDSDSYTSESSFGNININNSSINIFNIQYIDSNNSITIPTNFPLSYVNNLSIYDSIINDGQCVVKKIYTDNSIIKLNSLHTHYYNIGANNTISITNFFILPSAVNLYTTVINFHSNNNNLYVNIFNLKSTYFSNENNQNAYNSIINVSDTDIIDITLNINSFNRFSDFSSANYPNIDPYNLTFLRSTVRLIRWDIKLNFSDPLYSTGDTNLFNDAPLFQLLFNDTNNTWVGKVFDIYELKYSKVDISALKIQGAAKDYDDTVATDYVGLLFNFNLQEDAGVYFHIGYLNLNFSSNTIQNIGASSATLWLYIFRNVKYVNLSIDYLIGDFNGLTVSDAANPNLNMWVELASYIYNSTIDFKNINFTNIKRFIKYYFSYLYNVELIINQFDTSTATGEYSYIEFLMNFETDIHINSLNATLLILNNQDKCSFIGNILLSSLTLGNNNALYFKINNSYGISSSGNNNDIRLEANYINGNLSTNGSDTQFEINVREVAGITLSGTDLKLEFTYNSNTLELANINNSRIEGVHTNSLSTVGNDIHEIFIDISQVDDLLISKPIRNTTINISTITNTVDISGGIQKGIVSLNNIYNSGNDIEIKQCSNTTININYTRDNIITDNNTNTFFKIIGDITVYIGTPAGSNNNVDCLYSGIVSLFSTVGSLGDNTIGDYHQI